MEKRHERPRARVHTLLGVLALILPTACTSDGAPQLEALLGTLLPASGAALDEETVASGLREALSIGSNHASQLAGRVDGYWKNPRLRIPLPGQLQPAADTLRRFGFGEQVDAIEVSMNRAAEQAAGEAAPIFMNAIRAMTIRDAFDILQGPDDAATQYLRRTTGEQLAQRFRPIVDTKVQEVGLARLYQDSVRTLAAIPGAPGANVDLVDFVTQRGIDGLFLLVADEEKKIRTDPAARATDLLKRVFANQS